MLTHSALAQPAPASGSDRERPRWPNSDRRLNFAAGLTPGMVQKATPETMPVVAPAVIWSVYSDPRTDGLWGHRNLTRVLANEPVKPVAGRYFSALSVREQTRLQPPETAPLALVRDDRLAQTFGNEAGRRLIDIRKPEVRQRLAEHFVAAARADADFLALDNFTAEYFTPPGLVAAEWDAAQYALLDEIHRAARAAGVRVVPNFASRPEKVWARLIPLVDGIVYEMPIHRNVQKMPDVLEGELAAYRAALDAGLLVGLIPDARQVGLVAASAMLIREPGDALFVSHREYAPRPAEWMTWPETWGAARGKYVREGSRFSRDFERARLEIDYSTQQITITPK
jgi:hypothetical protein